MPNLCLMTLLTLFASGTQIKEEDWSKLEIALDEERENFFAKLRSTYPAMNEMDFRVCMAKELGLTWRQMTHLFFISPDSVKRRYQRIKKKYLNNNISTGVK